MEQSEVLQRPVGNPSADQSNEVTCIWTILYNAFHTAKHWLLLLIQSLQNVRATPLAYSLANYRQMVGWDEACIRCIVFHPSSQHQAVVTSQDIVYLCGLRDDPQVQLQAAEQVDLYCAAFRPCASRELAVGCAAGIYIWWQVSNDLWAKRLLCHTQHIHVTSVQWNGHGTALASVALGTRQIIVWEQDSGQAIRLFSASISFLLYSPNFQMLFGACSDAGASVCYVDHRIWHMEHILKGRPIQAAAWTACSTYLLFVQKDDTNLYSITRYADLGVFLKPQLFWTFEVVADLHDMYFSGERLCHGQAQAIAVDPLNTYLAVIYKRQPFVLIYKLSLPKYSKLRILPWTYVHCDQATDQASVYPTCMCFGHAKENGRQALAIGWNSGHYQMKMLNDEQYNGCS